jgi:nucleotide-binding universal stress UspA family protein
MLSSSLTVVPHLSPELDPAVEEYARLEHVPIREAELALVTADNVLDNALTKARANGIARISAEPSFGDPATEFIKVAQTRQADLIVVGNRGQGRLASHLLGSVAQKVVSLAHCPVVVVR